MKKLLLISMTVPRWVILLIDFVITVFSFALSIFIVKQFEFSEIVRGDFFIYTGLYCITSLSVFFIMRIHTGLIRYSSTQDTWRIFLAVLIASFIYIVADSLFVEDKLFISSLKINEVVLINFFIASSLHILLRTSVKNLFCFIKQLSSEEKESVLIYGSDSNAILIKQAIESSSSNKFHIAGFLESSNGKINTYIELKKIYPVKSLALLKEKKKIDKVIMMNEQLAGIDKKLVIERCLKLGIKVLTVPPTDQWIYGKLSLRQIQELKIEDLLQREPIVINNQKLSEDICGKRVLITGAAGSIGSEIVRQVLKYQPQMVILCDQAESPLHETQLKIEEEYPEINIKVFIASIRDYNRMQIPFREYRPQIVFHAAAYKHVPMMEHHPCEAIQTNILGTKNVADLAVIYKAQKFVMISTDKAVNPTNVMGASKRIAEMYVQSLSSALETSVEERYYGHVYAKEGKPVSSGNLKTKFITTRFGNVLGSNGSVIPRFREQIQKGGPVTVTDPEITRFFMTIPEAVQLVLEAGIMGSGGEIFIFDMGKPVKIVDLARKMIRLTGLVPDEDIKIVYTGLRPGEKLYEELLNKEEKTLPTHHEKIKIARIIPCSPKTMSDIEELISMANHDENEELVRKMKELVPEFLSKNSVFEKLDKPKPIKEAEIEEMSFNKNYVN